jgi:hypothetical protein
LKISATSLPARIYQALEYAEPSSNRGSGKKDMNVIAWETIQQATARMAKLETIARHFMQ